MQDFTLTRVLSDVPIRFLILMKDRAKNRMLCKVYAHLFIAIY